ncbi:MAG TPA: nitroreductase family protein [Firmicutes bacterium]|nr:nitroreductase family protein [Bacillota bacterium]
MDPILARRSIRKYTAQAVPAEDITYLLQAAMSAPSANNEQPWHFVVIKDRKLMAEIPKIHPYAQMVPGAQLVIMVCGDLSRDATNGYWVQDCAAATENILIAAQNKGLGAVWLGVYPRQERVHGLQQLFGLPEKVLPFALVPLGYPAEHKPPADRFNPARVHYDRW